LREIKADILLLHQGSQYIFKNAMKPTIQQNLNE